MYLERIELINFKGITKFTHDFSGNVYFITGENELGKSSVLEAIVRLLTGNRENVLKNGTKEGNAIIEIGGYKVEWKYTEKNPRGIMTITTPEGMKSDNISTLQKIFCYQDFDAQEFAAMSETAEGRRRQVALVMKLLPTPIQKRLAEIAVETAQNYDGRREANSILKTFKTLEETTRKELPNNVENYAQPIDVASLLESQKQETQLEERYKQALQRKAERTQQIAEIPGRLESYQKNFDVQCEEMKRAEQKAKDDCAEIIRKAEKEKDDRLAELAQKHADACKFLEAKQKEIGTEKIEFEEKLKNATQFCEQYEKANTGDTVAQKLSKATQHNENHKKYVAYIDAFKKRQETQKAVDKYESVLIALTTEKEKLIRESTLPIEGLSFTDDGLELKGVQFAQGKVSDSQIMEVATALIIASNPKVKVFRVARGESLGAIKLKILVDLAKKNGYQGFIEEVRRGENELKVEEYTEIY